MTVPPAEIALWLKDVAAKARKTFGPLDTRQHVFACIEAGETETAQSFAEIGRGAYWAPLFLDPASAETVLANESLPPRELDLLLDIVQLRPDLAERAIARYVELASDAPHSRIQLGRLAETNLNAARTLADAAPACLDAQFLDHRGAKRFVAELLRHDFDAAILLAPQLADFAVTGAALPELGVELSAEDWIRFGRAATRASESYGVDWLLSSIAASLVRGLNEPTPRVDVAFAILDALDDKGSGYPQVAMRFGDDARKAAHIQSVPHLQAAHESRMAERMKYVEPGTTTRTPTYDSTSLLGFLINEGLHEEAAKVLADRKKKLTEPNLEVAYEAWRLQQDAASQKELIAAAKHAPADRRTFVVRPLVFRIRHEQPQLALKLAKTVSPTYRHELAKHVLDGILPDVPAAMKALKQLIPKDSGSLSPCSLRVLRVALSSPAGQPAQERQASPAPRM